MYVYCKIHFNKKCNESIKINNINNLDNGYKKEIKNYWKQYGINVDTRFHRWYSGLNGNKDVRYIPEGFFYDVIERHYNNLGYEKAFTDKTLFTTILPNVKQPTTIFSNRNGIYYDEDNKIITLEDCINKIINKDFFIKPSVESGGKNANFVNKISDSKLLLKTIEEYKKDFIAQEPIKQHNDLSVVHPSSVNTIRTMSYFDGKEVKILSSILRMGVKDSKVDNESSDGVSCGITKDGILKRYTRLANGTTFDGHPDGFKTEGHKINNYSKVIEVIKESHKLIPYFKLISWDFSIDEDGNPLMIEYNTSWCGINFHQFNNGPLFGDMTDEMLKEISNK